MKDPLRFVNRGIRFSFYALFFSVPLVLYPKTFELFEFNKLWLVYAISLIILFFWGTKMILEERIIFKRTPLDIPLLLFLTSQAISTFISIDPHVSFWGYYSRFNGGLLSLATYIFLYYAFTSNFFSEDSNFSKITSYKVLLVSLFSGFVVALWGLPSHFGYDLTCLVFRGTLDVSCWTEAFQPTVRLFSTLGQPNWLSAYFSILIPIAIALGLHKFISNRDSEQNPRAINYYLKGDKLFAIFYLLFTILLFVELLWTQSQSGFLGLSGGLVVFFGAIVFYLFKKKSALKIQRVRTSLKILGILVGIFIISAFLLGHPLKERLPFSTLQGVINLSSSASSSPQVKQNTNEAVQVELGGSDSGKIRLVVWQGALDLFKQNPLFGTGVETFAFAYYKVKPLEHNLLSEWDYLYNKAHNEYLNYLATTGIFGLGSYLLFIGWFIYYAFRKINRDLSHISPSRPDSLPTSIFPPLVKLALLSSFITILVSNFFGFSVVVINFYFFLIPAIFICFTFVKKGNIDSKTFEKPGIARVAVITGFGVVCLYFEFFLLNTWFADQEYALGYNLDRAQEFVMANSRLENAVKLNPGEDLYKSELSLNLATLALFLSEQDQTTESASFVSRATKMADDVINKHPHNIVFYKTRIQTYFVLSELNDKYFDEALSSIKKARNLAPTDAKIAYNEGLLYGQKGDIEKAVESLKEAIKLKPNYRDPRYAVSVYLIELSKKETDPAKAQILKDEARANLDYSLKNIIPDDPQVKELLKSIE